MLEIGPAIAQSVHEYFNLHFGKEIVVAVFMGSRPTAGFSVEIVSTRVDGVALVVQYRETRPARDAIVAQILTMPYHIAAVPKRAGVTDVRFEKLP